MAEPLSSLEESLQTSFWLHHLMPVTSVEGKISLKGKRKGAWWGCFQSELSEYWLTGNSAAVVQDWLFWDSTALDWHSELEWAWLLLGCSKNPEHSAIQQKQKGYVVQGRMKFLWANCYEAAIVEHFTAPQTGDTCHPFDSDTALWGRRS